MANYRLTGFSIKLQQRLADIKQGYVPDCVDCLDLDYKLDAKTREPTLCVLCAAKNMLQLQQQIKDVVANLHE